MKLKGELALLANFLILSVSAHVDVRNIQTRSISLKLPILRRLKANDHEDSSNENRVADLLDNWNLPMSESNSIKNIQKFQNSGTQHIIFPGFKNDKNTNGLELNSHTLGSANSNKNQLPFDLHGGGKYPPARNRQMFWNIKPSTADTGQLSKERNSIKSSLGQHSSGFMNGYNTGQQQNLKGRAQGYESGQSESDTTKAFNFYDSFPTTMVGTFTREPKIWKQLHLKTADANRNYGDTWHKDKFASAASSSTPVSINEIREWNDIGSVAGARSFAATNGINSNGESVTPGRFGANGINAVTSSVVANAFSGGHARTVPETVSNGRLLTVSPGAQSVGSAITAAALRAPPNWNTAGFLSGPTSMNSIGSSIGARKIGNAHGWTGARAPNDGRPLTGFHGPNFVSPFGTAGAINGLQGRNDVRPEASVRSFAPASGLNLVGSSFTPSGFGGVQHDTATGTELAIGTYGGVNGINSVASSAAANGRVLTAIPGVQSIGALYAAPNWNAVEFLGAPTSINSVGSLIGTKKIDGAHGWNSAGAPSYGGQLAGFHSGEFGGAQHSSAAETGLATGSLMNMYGSGSTVIKGGRLLSRVDPASVGGYAGVAGEGWDVGRLPSAVGLLEGGGSSFMARSPLVRGGMSIGANEGYSSREFFGEHQGNIMPLEVGLPDGIKVGSKLDTTNAWGFDKLSPGGLRSDDFESRLRGGLTDTFSKSLRGVNGLIPNIAFEGFEPNNLHWPVWGYGDRGLQTNGINTGFDGMFVG